jgi:ribosomal protein S18 acetylase RimI-like enzyme
MFIYGLSVYEDARNRGLGSILLHEAETIGINNGVTRLRLIVEKPKTWTYDFYIRRGYEFWDEDEEYVYLVKYV